MSTPYLGYADLLWNGSMVETLRFLRGDRWPFLLRDVAARAADGYERFRREYDHLAVGARYFEEARALEMDRERAARHALTAILCWDSYLYHGEFMENPSREKGRKADQSRRDFARLYWTTAFYRTYARSFGDGGCPGIDSHR